MDYSTMPDEQLHALAEQGDGAAMKEIGLQLYNNDQVDEAVHWWERAAEAGNGVAMSNLGVVAHKAGRSEDAERWYRRSMKTGCVFGFRYLGQLFHFDRADLRRAKSLYEQGAALGDIACMNNLGIIERGAGHVEVAERWYRQGAELGDGLCMSNLASALFTLDRIDESRSWLERAIAADDPEGRAVVLQVQSWFEDLDDRDSGYEEEDGDGDEEMAPRPSQTSRSNTERQKKLNIFG